MLPVDDPPNVAPDIYRDRFERCFRDHYAQVLAFSMRRVCGREIAEDVVADTFAVAWRRPSEILTAAREIARGHLRRRPAITTTYVCCAAGLRR